MNAIELVLMGSFAVILMYSIVLSVIYLISKNKTKRIEEDSNKRCGCSFCKVCVLCSSCECNCICKESQATEVQKSDGLCYQCEVCKQCSTCEKCTCQKTITEKLIEATPPEQPVKEVVKAKKPRAKRTSKTKVV